MYTNTGKRGDRLLTQAEVLADEAEYLRTGGADSSRIALCLSGGGIRSATYGLGVLQGLACRGLLRSFDYLSTVSGGGYMGSWLSAWIHRRGMDQVVSELSSTPGAPDTPKGPIQHLREYSNYLTPRLGFLSADTWTLVATYLRNLVLNWLVMIPALAAVIMLPRLALALFNAPQPGYWIVAVFAIAVLLRVGAVRFVAAYTPSVGRFGTGPTPIRGPLSGAQTGRRIEEQTGGFGIDQSKFLSVFFVQLVASSIFLTLAWKWNVGDLSTGGAGAGAQRAQWPHACTVMIGFILAVNGTGWLLGILPALRASRVTPAAPQPGTGVRTSHRHYLVELTVAVGASLIEGGLLFGLTRAARVGPLASTAVFVTLAPTAYLLAFFLSLTVYTGLITGKSLDEDREWWARLSAWVLIAAVVWPALCILALFGPPVLALGWSSLTSLSLGVVTGATTLTLGHSDKTPTGPAAKAERSWSQLIRRWALNVCAPLFTAFLIIVIATATAAALREHIRVPNPTWDAVMQIASAGSAPWWVVAISAAGLLLFALGISRFVDCNKYSLHAMYRSRLIRAYLGASNPERCPNRFTGFDPADNLRMHELRQPKGGDSTQRPLHVINVALNLVGGDQLAWQERKASSFIISPLHCGNHVLGYRDAEFYGGPDRGNGETGIALGTAITISGAAVSPNMGYHSSPVVGFLMMLFNVRLGWWLGNPGENGRRTYMRAGPRFGWFRFIQEAFGKTNDKTAYVYLSDGGHFENLGLYEMVRRQCPIIVVSDAGCDPEHGYADLGNAVRKIRIDLGVPIEFDNSLQMCPRAAKRKSGIRCAIGTIKYSRVDRTVEDGTIIYFKPTYYGDESADVISYACDHPDFPHESTVDQWFTESQFESYRRLGMKAIESVFGEGNRSLTIAEFVDLCRAHDRGEIRRGEADIPSVGGLGCPFAELDAERNPQPLGNEQKGNA